jgi:hypothetical protein
MKEEWYTALHQLARILIEGYKNAVPDAAELRIGKAKIKFEREGKKQGM